MRTAIYVDGYNLYYGLLKSTPYKWLNIHGLFDSLVKENDPLATVVHCGFYTSMVKSRMASHGEKAVQSQSIYHKALQSPYTPLVKVVCRSHSLEIKPLITFFDNQPPDKSKRTRVWVTTEKKIDVLMALDAYRMAASGNVDQIVLVTNDTDHEPQLTAIKDDFPQIRRGVIVPRRPHSSRPASQDLRAASHWMRAHVNESELAAFQFKDRIGTGKKPAVKPDYW